VYISSKNFSPLSQRDYLILFVLALVVTLVIVVLQPVPGYKEGHSPRLQLGVLGWLGMLLAESLFFPFASGSGGFFHAGTAFQPLWFALAPLGLDVCLVRISRNNKKAARLTQLFSAILLIIMVLFSAIWIRSAWWIQANTCIRNRINSLQRKMSGRTQS
jgi:heme/copper-type cytochrome/quinol oxidase subunit 4